MKTGLASELELARHRIQYDEHVKQVLGNRYILAWILKEAVAEFCKLPVLQIAESCIQTDIEIARVPVLPGQSNLPELIIGDAAEDKIPNEGFITYDIRFHAVLPTQPEQSIKLLINLEAQKSFSLGYPLITRGIFYGARMISSQLNREFQIPHYGDLKKVYSIWICMNAPKTIGNAINMCCLTRGTIIGDIPIKKEDYDKLSIIMITLDNTMPGNGIFRLLNTLLSTSLSVQEKETILEKEYSIPIHQEDFAKEAQHMCNLSEFVLEQGIEQGIELTKQVWKLSAQGLPISEIADKLNISIEKVKDILK